MYYSNGLKIQLADQVKIGGFIGTVVALIEEDLYLDGYLSKDWSYLGCGALILFDNYGLIYYKDVEPDVYFIGRKNK